MRGADLLKSKVQRTAGLLPADIERARELHLAELAYADQKFGELLDELTAPGLTERVEEHDGQGAR